MAGIRRRLELLEASASERLGRACPICTGPLHPDPIEEAKIVDAALSFVHPDPMPWQSAARERCLACGRPRLTPAEAIAIARRLRELRPDLEERGL